MEHHRLLLAGVVVLALLAAVVFSGPSITGYLPTETISQGIDLQVDRSQRFYLQSDDVLALRGFSLTGTVDGKGLFKAYLLNPSTGERLLVLSNDRPSGGAMKHITGFATINVVPGELLDVIETGKFDPGADSFVNECRETCTLDSAEFSGREFVLDLIVEPGVSAKISRMRFVLARD